MSVPDTFSSPPDSIRPWWKRWWGIAYIALLGISLAAIVVITLTVPTHHEGVQRMEALGITVVILDGLLAIPIAIAIFRPVRRFKTVPRGAWIAHLIWRIIFFVICIYLVWSAMFILWMVLGSVNQFRA